MGRCLLPLWVWRTNNTWCQTAERSRAFALQRVRHSVLKPLQRRDMVRQRLAGEAVVVAPVEGRRQAEMRRPGLFPECGLFCPVGLAARAHRGPHLDADILGVAPGL